jgi:hypothetical protein
MWGTLSGLPVRRIFQEIGHFRCVIPALDCAGRAPAATALCLYSPTVALGEVSFLTTRSKAASRFACRRSPKDGSDPGAGFVDIREVLLAAHETRQPTAAV